MEIKKLIVTVKCDMGLCPNKAVYAVTIKNNILRRQLNICEDCARSLFTELGKLFTPKSPVNINSRKNANLRGER